MSNSYYFPSQFSIVLVEPSHPGNIGATARAMNNMGIQQLRLVNPCDHLHSDAKKFAANSHNILENAQIFSSAKEAVADCQHVIATSARFRDRHRQVTRLWDLPQEIQTLPKNSSIALLFGRERVGLNNEEMDLCHEWVYIPTFGESSSLNLAQSAIVMLYEISKGFSLDQSPPQKITSPLASSGQIEGIKSHLLQVLKATGFLKDGYKAPVWADFADLIGRAKPNEKDIKIIRGFLNRIEVSLGTKKTNRQKKEEG